MLELLKRIIPNKLFLALQPAYHFLMSWLSACLYGFPSRRLIVIGVTGTAGKTSTVYLIAKSLQAAGYRTGFTSTSVLSDGREEILNDRKMTMPGRFFISSYLKRMVQNGCRYAVLETTSEGIRQFRHRFINYDALVFTGLYPEHIESHGSYEKYRAAKGQLFDHLRRCRHKYVNEDKRVARPKSGLRKLELFRVRKSIIANGDSSEAPYFLSFPSDSKLVYHFQELAGQKLIDSLPAEARSKDFVFLPASDLEADISGTRFSVAGQDIALRLLGGFNAQNALAAYAVLNDQGIAAPLIKSGLESVKSLAGKLDKVEQGQDFSIIIDYAFEPQALAKLYQVIDLMPHNRLIHLLGSTGGGRDRARRPILGKMAGEKADYVVVTNEDPYDEDPQAIIDMVAAGVESAGKREGENLFRVLDRQEAIRRALALAEPGDLVLLTGKGAEQYICLAQGSKIAWDERQEVEKALSKMGFDKT